MFFFIQLQIACTKWTNLIWTETHSTLINTFPNKPYIQWTQAICRTHIHRIQLIGNQRDTQLIPQQERPTTIVVVVACVNKRQRKSLWISSNFLTATWAWAFITGHTFDCHLPSKFKWYRNITLTNPVFWKQIRISFANCRKYRACKFTSSRVTLKKNPKGKTDDT